ncbi:response regulator [Sulfitobacter delicatus]|uniref:Response regulator receiver domain-containing protein n=1 Tax=Sulfitobacter delicatus TaxID=218672 RepID=A0A1G7Z6V5_9RHOB|nr:response regulator [Sulfitobacter delicatus]SDH04438.1 Response regulator receiver domain-containing protein [Sulfitobacter delicatus]
MKVLAVDDDPIILEMIEATFRQSRSPKISLTVLSSGPAALELLATSDQLFDCIFLDIEMPEMDGITLCSHIRAQEGYRYTPVIMLTQRTETASIERAFMAGATDYVTKPFDPKVLRSRLRVAKRMMQGSSLAPRLSLSELHHGGRPGQHNFAFGEPLHIEDVHQLVLPFPLGNYLLQLAQADLGDCHVFAATIEDSERLYAQGSTREYGVAIAATVAAIANVVNLPQLLMAHNGHGTLLCVVASVQLPKWPQLEKMIQDEVDTMELQHDNETWMDLSVSIGRPIRPNASQYQRVKRTFSRAIQRVVRRQKALSDTPPPEIPPVSAAH